MLESLCSVFLWIRLYSRSSRITTQIVLLFVLQPISIQQQSQKNCQTALEYIFICKKCMQTRLNCALDIFATKGVNHTKNSMKYLRFHNACTNGMHYVLPTIYMHCFALFEVCTVTSVVEAASNCITRKNVLICQICVQNLKLHWGLALGNGTFLGVYNSRPHFRITFYH